MFKTRATELFGIKHPIIQGGMQWVSRAKLVAAVSNAGGLGILSALTFSSPQELASEIRRTRALTDNPFGVNLTLLPTLLPVDHDRYIDVILEERVGIVETAGRNPEAYIGRFKSAGIKVMHKCTSVRHALTAERVGCDAVSIDGFECAGHPGEEDITSLVLVPLAADALGVPVIASGGFADARGFVAALALGADGVNMGTRFLVAQEAPVHPAIKERLVRASERDTMLVLRSLGNTERVLRNSVAQRVGEMEKGGATIQELAPLVSGGKGREVLETGDLERGLLTVGQVVGLVREIPSAREIIESIISQAHQIVTARLPRLINSQEDL